MTHLRRMKGPTQQRFLRKLALCCCLSLMLASLSAQAQNNSSARVPPQEPDQQAINLNSLSSGRLQAIDWKRQELRIDGKRYAFEGDRLRVFHADSEISLIDLRDNADIRFQTVRRNGIEVITRIWAEGANSLNPS